MNSYIEEKFEDSKDLLNRISWPLRLVGAWPINETKTSKIRFTCYSIYCITYVAMEWWDLAMVFGNLELMILNLMETSIQTMTLLRLLIFKFNKLVLSVILNNAITIFRENHHDLEEKKIYLKYIATAEYFYKISMGMCIATGAGWWLFPFQQYFIARLTHQTAVLTPPYRIRIFFNISSMDRIIAVSIYQIGLSYTGVCYGTTFGIITICVLNICGQLAVITNRIINLSVVYTKYTFNQIFRNIVEYHLQIVRMANLVNDAFHMMFLFEFLTITLLISLITYNTLLNLDHAEPIGLIISATYALTMILFVYGNCIMGEYLLTESARLAEAFYKCQWHELPLIYRKALIICIARAQIPMQLTAGKFYVYSLSGFTGIIKSSMAYVSMLRKMI